MTYSIERPSPYHTLPLLHRLAQRPLEDPGESLSKSNYLHYSATCLSTLFTTAFCDVRDEALDAVKLIETLLKTLRSGFKIFTKSDKLFAEQTHEEKCKECFLKSLDLLSAVTIRPFVLVADITKLFVGIFMPQAAIRFEEGINP